MTTAPRNEANTQFEESTAALNWYIDKVTHRQGPPAPPLRKTGWAAQNDDQAADRAAARGEYLRDNPQ